MNLAWEIISPSSDFYTSTYNALHNDTYILIIALGEIYTHLEMYIYYIYTKPKSKERNNMRKF